MHWGLKQSMVEGLMLGALVKIFLGHCAPVFTHVQWFLCGEGVFKACVPYFLSIFSFFHQTMALQKLWKMFFISSKSSFHCWDIQIFIIFTLPSTFQIQKDRSKWNWLVWICRCNFWNNSRTPLYYIIKLGQIIYN